MCPLQPIRMRLLLPRPLQHPVRPAPHHHTPDIHLGLRGELVHLQPRRRLGRRLVGRGREALQDARLRVGARVQQAETQRAQVVRERGDVRYLLRCERDAG